MPGFVCFVRDETRNEFLDELKFTGQKAQEIAPGIFYGTSVERLYWVLDYWPAEKIEFSSISDGANKLRKLGRRWAYAGGANFRRGALIAQELKCPQQKELAFPPGEIRRDLPAFTLQNANTLLYSLTPLKSCFAGGRVRFTEDRKGPPSRAYLKLFEALTLAGDIPGRSDVALDLGATPGGWSYVLATLGTPVHMIDRAAPDAGLLKKFPQLSYHKGDGLNPPEEMLSRATVIVSDMACEVSKLLPSVQLWRDRPNIRLMVCTLKFHGMSDKKIIREFARIAGSEIYHLWYNGHELTWVWKRAG